MNKNYVLCYLLLMLGVFQVAGAAAQDLAPPGSNGYANWVKQDLAAPNSSRSWNFGNFASAWGKQDLLPAGSHGNKDWGKRDLQAPGARSNGQNFGTNHKN